MTTLALSTGNKLAIIVAARETRYARSLRASGRPRGVGCKDDRDNPMKKRDTERKGSMLQERVGARDRPARRKDYYEARHLAPAHNTHAHACGHVVYVGSIRGSRLQSLAHVRSPVAANEANRWIRSSEGERYSPRRYFMVPHICVNNCSLRAHTDCLTASPVLLTRTIYTGDIKRSYEIN